MAVIVILGAGMMGSAIGIPAAENGNDVRLVGTPLDREIIDHARATGMHLTMKQPLPANYTYYQYEELDKAMEGVELLVSGVSSFGVDWFCDNILTTIPENLPVLAITKGMVDLPDGTLQPYPLYYKAKLPHRKLHLNAVGGPCTSYELAQKDPTHVTFCGDDMEELRWIRSLFATDYYHISLSTDVVGVECAVAMKNAYALAVTLMVGMAQRREGLDSPLHYNSQAAMFGQSIVEMRRLLKLVGGSDDMITLGAGDLYVTVYGGRTRLIGTLLGRGMSFADAMEELKGVTLESIVIATRTARAVRTLIAAGKASEKDYPLLLHIDDIINHGAEVNIPWSQIEN